MSIVVQSLASYSSIMQTLIGVIIAVKESIMKSVTFQNYLKVFSGANGKKKLFFI